MTEEVKAVMDLLERCTPDEREQVFKRLRGIFRHPLEDEFGASAEHIMDAIYRGADLTKRMLRGVIADAAFHHYALPELENLGWADVKLNGNFSYDHRLRDRIGDVTVQVKLQRSTGEKTAQRTAVVTDGKRYNGLPADHYLVEVQRTRTGKRKVVRPDGTELEEVETRPYDYGSFDVLAVSLYPSKGDWSQFMYTLERSLLANPSSGKIATFQAVPKSPGGLWTDSFSEIAAMFRQATETGAPATRASYQFAETIVSPTPSGLFTQTPPENT